MNEKSLITLYESAKSYLIEKINRADAETILEHYISLSDGSVNITSIENLYYRLLSSAQNANMKAGVIGGSIGGVDKLGIVLCDFCPIDVVEKYNEDHFALLNEIESQLKPTGKVRKTPQSIWPRYCETALSAANFLSQFNSGQEFYAWANHYYNDPRSLAALPLILEQEIYGIGYPLACDFLKELGFINFGKPDIHIMDILSGVGLCDSKLTPKKNKKIIVEIALANRVSPYNVDKVFWLIGSGKFYDHPEISNTGRNKADFVQQYNS